MRSRSRPHGSIDRGTARPSLGTGGRRRRAGVARLAALCNVLVLAVAAPAGAQSEPDAATRRAARQLAEEGGELVDAGRYLEGVDRLSRAYALVPAPTIKLLEGQAREKLGQLVEAAEAYELVVRTELEPGAPQAFRDAVRDARTALTQIQPRIPQLTVVVDGVDPNRPGVEVLVGDAVLPPPLIGQKRPANPGPYEVALRIDGEVRARRDVQLREREKEQVILKLLAPRESSAESQSKLPRSPEPEAPHPSAVRGAAWTALAMGGLGFAVGLGSGLIMLDRKSYLDENCLEGRYCAGHEDQLEAFRTARTVSWIGWGIGITGAVAGAVLLVLPHGGREGGRALELRIHPRQVSVAGRF